MLVKISGKFYYEATVTDEGLCRVGWSTRDATFNLGTTWPIFSDCHLSPT